MPLRAKGEFALVEQHMRSALGKSGQPVKRGTMAHDHDVRMILADAAVQRRDLAAVREHALHLEELAVRDSHMFYLAIAHRAWGVAHRLAGASSETGVRLNRALELFNELGTRWQIGRTLVELGEMELANLDPARARVHFSGALAAFESLQARPDAERTRASLAALG